MKDRLLMYAWDGRRFEVTVEPVKGKEDDYLWCKVYKYIGQYEDPNGWLEDEFDTKYCYDFYLSHFDCNIFDVDSVDKCLCEKFNNKMWVECCLENDDKCMPDAKKSLVNDIIETAEKLKEKYNKANSNMELATVADECIDFIDMILQRQSELKK